MVYLANILTLRRIILCFATTFKSWGEKTKATALAKNGLSFVAKADFMVFINPRAKACGYSIESLRKASYSYC
jgi:hypothetical protein